MGSEIAGTCQPIMRFHHGVVDVAAGVVAKIAALEPSGEHGGELHRSLVKPPLARGEIGGDRVYVTDLEVAALLRGVVDRSDLVGRLRGGGASPAGLSAHDSRPVVAV
jgi:hypothetical protein